MRELCMVESKEEGEGTLLFIVALDLCTDAEEEGGVEEGRCDWWVPQGGRRGREVQEDRARGEVGREGGKVLQHPDVINETTFYPRVCQESKFCTAMFVVLSPMFIR